jgi:hypothetical protein
MRRIFPSKAAITVACCVLTPISQADTLHDIGGGAFRHHQSEWIFPQMVGEFSRVGAPQDLDGTVDVVAYYAHQTKDGPTTAIVDVYPADSSAADATYAASVAKLADGASTHGEIKLSGLLSLRAVKAISETQGQALYFVDTGPWIVKIRTTGVSVAASDAFVREQRWDTLALTKETCTGPSCAP